MTTLISTPTGHRITANLATTSRARRSGLRGWRGLATQHGMLFDFEIPGFHGITTVGMQFPIDIVWCARSGMIQTVAVNIGPGVVLRPTLSAQFVLELAAGEAQRLGLAPGQRLTF